MPIPLATSTTPLVPPSAHPIWIARGGGELHEGTKLLKTGSRKDPQSRAVVEDIIFEEDTPVTLRDGTKLRVDVFRPSKLEGTPIPTIVIWTPYGKSGKGVLRNIDMPHGMGQPRDLLSDYQCFEAPDPVEWCPRGYSLVHVDARGSGFSEGTINWWGPQITEDVYDMCDWISGQAWSNGSVGMTGSSWLGINQWWAAATDNPHPALKAIQPWEGLTDGYRQSDVRGGIPNSFFPNLIKKGFAGFGGVEDYPSVIDSQPLLNNYWESKQVPIEKLTKVPFYVIASYSTMLHTEGSVGAFRQAPIQEKWLRFHLNHEWVDIYEKESMDDSQRFFDHYLKGIENGWKSTPRVQLSLLDFSGKFNGGVINRSENEYPLARQQLKTLYLDSATGSLVDEPAPDSSTVSYDAKTGSASFSFIFDKYTEIVGYSGVVLYVSSADSDELDVGVQLRKMDSQGRLLEHINFDARGVDDVPDTNVCKYLGPDGVLRASFAVTLDPAKSTSNEFHHAFNKQRKIPLGEVVELNIPLWPAGMIFHAGEGIVLKVMGTPPRLPEFPGVGSHWQNNGDHIIRTGGKWKSRIVLPFV